MSNYQEELKKLERSKNAQFTLTGVIAARDQASGQKTHTAVEHICATIIEAYRHANDTSKSAKQKQDAIYAVAQLEPDLDWLVAWTKDEADNCRYAPAEQMQKMAKVIASQVAMIKSDFGVLRTKIEIFNHIFDIMLALLEQTTEFFKQGHGAEVMKVLDAGKNAYAECKNLWNIEVPSLLVPQSKLVKERAEDYLVKCENLVNIQEGSNQSLRNRADSAGLLLKGTLPDFILKSRDHLVNIGQHDHASIKAEQTAAYDSVVSCLDEITYILERIQANYLHTFEEDPLKARKDLDDLDRAAGDLFKNLAQIKIPTKVQDEMTQLQAAQALPNLTKTTMGAMAAAGAPADLQKELVAAVKHARDGTIPQYFESVNKMETIIQKAHAEPEFKISIGAQLTSSVDEGPKDMLEAAKAMCASLKGLNLALDL